ncbi:uncharacterized protein PHALS_14755 [Plasmopara halstedii]|uniref:Uncharacterized protein n=1 Tax=Plasmopara halstedii TaxID=4781 RepID=A0A0P1AS69_PLAHL|nr:uncharacterized protein PHALS_14755 [Plasmopara halstedii]CEG43916.1 hypothetical protein PHALS_14755 [Plasmopara halstedii]|eukprot:XP_024580285.1 hypothetical protein PHALS_14755 [Plasmopara halstedii]
MLYRYLRGNSGHSYLKLATHTRSKEMTDIDTEHSCALLIACKGWLYWEQLSTEAISRGLPLRNAYSQHVLASALTY